jgi:adenosyl cobinamide kinase/adenosyl cobinamide phosphate guanylyltransferase
MKLTLAQAALQVGKSKSTLLRAIKNGTVSAERVEHQYLIDSSELFRVFQPISQTDAHHDESRRESWRTMQQSVEAVGAAESGEVRALNVLIDTLKDVNAALQTTNGTLLAALEGERLERQKLTLMLAHQSAQDAPKQKPEANGWPLVILAVLLVLVSVGAVVAMRLGLI